MPSSSIAKRPDGKWRARYRDDAGKEHARHFTRKVDAQRWLDEVTASIVTGQYVDPRAGKVTFKEYAESWRAIQVHRPTTAARIETLLRRHVYPALGSHQLGSIRPSLIQTWVTGLTIGECPLAPATVVNLHGVVAGIFKAAVRDRRISDNPCEGTRLPRAGGRPQMVPLSTAQVMALRAAVPDRLAAMVLLAAGSGLRQGEAFGLTVDRVDFLRKTVRVDRQLVRLSGEPEFGPPKTPASVRTVPVPDVVTEALAAHLAEFGTGPDGLVFTDESLGRLRRNRFSYRVWRPAVKASGVPAGTVFHDLRHHYASLLIHHGCSVKVVQSRLGHATAAETLDTYSHLWPDTDDQTREAIQNGLAEALADSLRTAGAV